MEFDVIEVVSKNDFEKIKILWNRLEKGKDMTFFQSYEWNIMLYNQWNNDLRQRKSGKIVLVYSETIIAPLIIQKRDVYTVSGIRKKGIYILGTGSYSDYMNFIYESTDKETINKIINFIRYTYNKTQYFQYIRKECVLSKILSENYEYITNVSVKVNVTHSREQYTQSLSKSTRQNLRTALNRMKKDNIQYKYEVVNGRLEDELVEELLECHRQRVISKNRERNSLINMLKNIYRISLLDNMEKNNNIIRNAMKQFDNSITVVVKLDGKLVGYLYGFKDEKIIRIVHNCYYEQYGFYSPVFRGTYDFVVDCCDNEIISYVDFTRGDEPYKYKLNGEEDVLCSYVIK